MKNSIHPVAQSQQGANAQHAFFPINRANALFLLLTITILSVLASSCTKEVHDEMNNTPADLPAAAASTAQSNPGNALNLYDGLSAQTRYELQQAQAATAKYKNIENALRDGYKDIEVDVEHMGHHYMNMSLIDGTFDPKQPEILVYNRNARGVQELVAVEYAVPLNLPRPAGFTGSADVWKDDSGFPFWLVHAWVWSYNPDGVFNWTNPLIDLM